MNQNQKYEIKLDIFKGPIELLMHLIEKNKIDIYDIPIALLTEQYLNYLDEYKSLNIEIASEFMVMAATLLQIKSRILLPKRQLSPLDEEEEDPRRELVERLLEYKKFKQVTNILEDMAIEQGRSFYREPLANKVPITYEGNMDIKILWQAFQKILKDKFEDKIVQKITKEKYTVDTKIKEILDLIINKKEKVFFFTDFFSSMENKEELVISFLALLELIRLKKISVYQDNLFSPIKVKWQDER